MGNNIQGLPEGVWVGIILMIATVFLVLLSIAFRLYRSITRLEHDDAIKAVEKSYGTGTDSTEEMSGRLPTSPLSFTDKLGLGGMMSLYIPVPLIVASLGFLSSFWAASAQPSNSTLQGWLLGNKMPTIVTIASLVLRSGVLGQTALGISMIASLALEKFLARPEDVPTLMIHRSSKAASSDLLLLFLKRMTGQSNQRPTWLLLPLLLLTMVSFGLQFTSTLLLLDLGTGNVPGTLLTTPIPLGYSSNLINQRLRNDNDVNYAGSPPPAYPPFAELTSGVPQSHHGIDYTGVSLRAFLPFTSQADLLSLREFSGYVTMINTTTLCARPPIRDISFNRASDPLSLKMNVALDVPTLEHQLDEYKLSPLDFFDDRFSDEGNRNQYHRLEKSGYFNGIFNCTISAYASTTFDNDGYHFYTPHMCSLGGVRSFAFVEGIPTNYSTEIDIRKAIDMDTHWWEAMNASDITLSEDGSWTIASSSTSLITIQFKISVCSTILEPQYQLVNVSSTSPLTGRVLAADNSTGTPDPANLLQWLGVSDQSMAPAERGILSLEESDWLNMDGFQPNHGLITRPLAGNPMGQYYDNSTTYRLCFSCSSSTADGLEYLHPVYTALILRSLTDKGPAEALQAFWTLVYQSYYYDTLQFFDFFDTGTYTSWTPVLVPVRWGGFITVCCMAAVHLLSLFGILFVFVRQTRFSRLHDPWLAYTQAWNGELADVLHEVTRSRIVDPAVFIEYQNKRDDMVGLRPDALERSVGVRKRGKDLTDFDSSNDSDQARSIF